nr:hypothetical protein [Tanacetum cinerariifolium]
MEAPPSPDYVSGPEYPPSLEFVPEPIYPEFMPAEDDILPTKEQPLPVAALPTAESLGNEGDDEDESSDDKEDEYLALLTLQLLLYQPLIMLHLLRRLSRLRSTNTEITRLMAMPTPPPSPFSPLSSPLPQIPSPPLPLLSSPLIDPTYEEAPLGYRAARLRWKAKREEIPEADLPLRKRLCTAHTGSTPAAMEVGYDITDTWDDLVGAIQETAPTTLEGVDQRVTELDTTVRPGTEEFELRFEEAQDDQAFLRAQVNTLSKDRPDHHPTSMLLDRDAQVAALIAQTSSLQTQLTTTLRRIEILEARDPEPQERPAETGSSC